MDGWALTLLVEESVEVFLRAQLALEVLRLEDLEAPHPALLPVAVDLVGLVLLTFHAFPEIKFNYTI